MKKRRLRTLIQGSVKKPPSTNLLGFITYLIIRINYIFNLSTSLQKKNPTTPPVMLKTCMLSSGPMSCPEEFNVTCADSETFLSQGIEGIRFVWGGGGIPRHIFDDFLCKSKKKSYGTFKGGLRPSPPIRIPLSLNLRMYYSLRGV